MSNANLSFLGLADVYLKPYGVAGAAVHVGSVSACDVTHEEDAKVQQNFGRDGGVLNTVRRLTSVGVNLTFQSLSINNLARALRGGILSVDGDSVVDEDVTADHDVAVALDNFNLVASPAPVVKNSAGTTTYVAGTDYTINSAAGTITALSTGAITDAQALKVSYTHRSATETHTAYAGALIRTAKMDIGNVVVTNEAGTTTYVAGTDYRVTGAGVVILDGGSIADDSTVKVKYTYSAQQVVEALTQGQQEYTLYFDGLNEADNNRNVAVDLHRIKFGLPSSLSLIGDDFITMSVEGEALVDSTQTGVGASKFYRWTYPTAA